MSSDIRLKEQLPRLTDRIVETYTSVGTIIHLGHCPLPKYEEVIEATLALKEIIYPGYRRREGLHIGIVNLATTGGSASAKMLGPGIDLLNRMSEGLGYDALVICCSVLFLLGGLLLLPLKVDAGDTISPRDLPEADG